MKYLKKRLRLIIGTLICLILLQSCSVYKRERVSLDKAVEKGKRVKIKTTDGETLKFKKIVLDSGMYYGIKKIKRDFVKVQILSSDIESLRLQNKTLSTIYNITLGMVVTTFVLIVIVASSYKGPDIEFNNQFPN